MEAVIFVGIQASGKSTFYASHFSLTHMRLNLDMLNTRHREAQFLQTCLKTSTKFVIDNTNPTPDDRARYIEPAQAADFRVVGYYFQSKLEEVLARNAQRPREQRIPDAGVLNTYNRLQLPSYEEGFDDLFYVRIGDADDFIVEAWAE